MQSMSCRRIRACLHCDTNFALCYYFSTLISSIKSSSGSNQYEIVFLNESQFAQFNYHSNSVVICIRMLQMHQGFITTTKKKKDLSFHDRLELKF